MRMMFGGQTDEFDFHYFGWNFQFMKDFLITAGFKKIERVKTFSLFKDTSDYAPYGVPISLNVIAQKQNIFKFHKKFHIFHLKEMEFDIHINLYDQCKVDLKHLKFY